MKKIKVIAVFDIGKTNKKIFLFNEDYEIVFERSTRLIEIKDEDGYPCENLNDLRLFVYDALHEVFRDLRFEVKAVNFSAYGASLVLLDERGMPLSPLYNYLKPYPEELEHSLYKKYGGKENFCLQTASPSLGSLNSGLQLYRLLKESPAKFKQMSVALHLPQYVSYLITGQLYSDMTSIGCHTALWDYTAMAYHKWVVEEGLANKLAPIEKGSIALDPIFSQNSFIVGMGLHDSSAALIPYLLSFREPFVLISTGTWSISMNPYNKKALTKYELENDCLFYLSYLNSPVKAARIFLGNEHDIQSKRIADFFGQDSSFFKGLRLNKSQAFHIERQFSIDKIQFGFFAEVDLDMFSTAEEAYYALNVYLVNAQIKSLNLILEGDLPINKLFVDGGFSKNDIFMQLLAAKLNDLNISVFAASVAQATALGAALAMHEHWNDNQIPSKIIEIKNYTKAIAQE
ncbi:FGGY family carbohydrate kinase [Sphingobacterium sp. UT-1RO-CII-1]|uniref:FGGY-family carbohydrate kinase n=1 Tax=Sphingobacterium sp. UT-1RO-CII-1 TaxID=2995225 RepID=UPI00227CDEBA|nr:FGGY family carbohydrate kinase [Sphingobacterium sp. UT-1RO-CII-1]MCY4778365.1 FGGY family carbohydrate kinase [Sphingobacterium sp. UT-1RO-CII-1]